MEQKLFLPQLPVESKAETEQNKPKPNNQNKKQHKKPTTKKKKTTQNKKKSNQQTKKLPRPCSHLLLQEDCL